jgi:hypothetical protein
VKALALSLLVASAAAALAQSSASTHMSAGSVPEERLGTVSFAQSCSPRVQAAFNRGVALLHDFWYAEAQPQFERIAKEDPHCAMAHWGIAMSVFQQIWEPPGEDSMKLGWEEMQKAQSIGAPTQRERDYIAALAAFYKPGNTGFQARVTAYSAAMGALYRKYPGDVDAGAFYALSLLASEAPNDTSLTHQHEAMAVLAPLFAKDPDNPGVVHYTIHSCDNPAMARQGLAAAEHYGEIAPSGPHAAHMPGHIFARLGMWQQDIDAQLASIRASEGRAPFRRLPHVRLFAERPGRQCKAGAREERSRGRTHCGSETRDGRPHGRLGGYDGILSDKIPCLLRVRNARLESCGGAPAGPRRIALGRGHDLVGARHRRRASAPCRASEGRSGAI